MVYYKAVKRLKNGARVSIFMPKESGLRKTYMANGVAILVDGGMVFTNEDAAKTFMLGRWSDGYEVWECEIKNGTKAQKYFVSLTELSKTWVMRNSELEKKEIEYLKDVKRLIEGKISIDDVSLNVVYYWGGGKAGWDSEDVIFANGIRLIKLREDLRPPKYVGAKWD